MHNTYGKFENTFAATLSNEIKTNNVSAKIRKFESARHAALNSNKIPESVYDILFETINDHLPLLHRYINLLKKFLELDELHMYDLYKPFFQDFVLKLT